MGDEHCMRDNSVIFDPKKMIQVYLDRASLPSEVSSNSQLLRTVLRIKLKINKEQSIGFERGSTRSGTIVFSIYLGNNVSDKKIVRIISVDNTITYNFY